MTYDQHMDSKVEKNCDTVEAELLALLGRGATETELADFCLRELQWALGELRAKAVRPARAA